MKINVWTLRLHGYQESVFWREALKGSLSAKRAGRRRVLIEGGEVLLTPLSLKMAMDGCDWDTDNHLTDTAHDYEDDQTLRRQWSGYCKLTNLLLIWRWVGKIEKHPNMKVGERVEFLRRRWNGKQIGDWGKCGSQPGLSGLGGCCAFFRVRLVGIIFGFWSLSQNIFLILWHGEELIGGGLAVLGWVKRRGNQGRGEVARHQTLSRLGERCCWEISRWEETNWKFVGAGMYILGSVLSGLTWWQSFWEEEQMVLRQGRGKQFWENSNEHSVDERRQEMRSAGRRDIMSYRWRGQTGSCDWMTWLEPVKEGFWISAAPACAPML